MLEQFVRYLSAGGVGGLAILTVFFVYTFFGLQADIFLLGVTLLLPSMVGAWAYNKFYAQNDINLLLKELIEPIKTNRQKEKCLKSI